MTRISRIRELCAEKGLKLRFLTEAIGVPNTYFADINRFNRTIPPDRLQVIADLLDTTPEYLNGLTDEKEKPGKVSLNELVSSAFPNDPTMRQIISQVASLSEQEQQQILSYLQFLNAQKQK